MELPSLDDSGKSHNAPRVTFCEGDSDTPKRGDFSPDDDLFDAEDRKQRMYRARSMHEQGYFDKLNFLSRSEPATPPSAPSRFPRPQRNKGAVFGGPKPQEALHGYSKARDEAEGDVGSKQGTVMGVIFPCMANILGVIVFLRGPWIVGLAGIGQALGLCLLCTTCTFITSLSLAAVSTNGKIRGGGSYFLISRSLGPSIGAGVGLVFFLANAVGGAMYIIGCVEAWVVALPDAVVYEAPEPNIRVIGTCFLIAATIAVGLKVIARVGSVILLMMVLLCLLCMYIGLLSGFTELSRADHIHIPLENFKTISNISDADYNETDLLALRHDILGPNSTSAWNLKNITRLEEYFTGPSIKNIKDNWGSNYTIREQYAFRTFEDTRMTFSSLLAIWFPACTGIMAGSNRSAELRNPSRSIPVGTLVAQIATTVMYLTMLFLFGASVKRKYLLNDPFFAATAAWPAKEVVTYGVIISSLGAGIQSLTSASRLLTAIAEDQTLPFLNFVNRDKSGMISLGCASVCSLIFVVIANLNTVAPFISMFFLICYFCVNACCFLLGFLGDASWRPTFRFYHWFVALVGMIMCAVFMFIISWWGALVALLIVGLTMFYSSMNSHDVNWGDGFRGVRHQLARDLLMRASEIGQQHTKNWRPQVLVLTGMTPDHDEEGLVIHDMNLIHFASQLKHGHGLCIVGGIVDAPDLGQGSFLSSMSTKHIRNWSNVVQQSLHDIGIDGFAEILYTSQRTEGIMTLIQTAGMGALIPNCVLVSWPFSWLINADARRRFIQTIQVCTIFQKTIIMAKEGHNFVLNNEVMRGTIDVWWVVADGGILLLLPMLLVRHKVWRYSKIRLYAITDQRNDDSDMIRTAVQQYCKEHRIQNIEIHIVAMDGEILFNPRSFTDLARRMRQRESLVATGLLPHNLTKKGRGDHVFTIHRNSERVWHVRNALGETDTNYEVHSDYGLEATANAADDVQQMLKRNVISDPLPATRPYRRLSARAAIPEFTSPVPSGSSRCGDTHDRSPGVRSPMSPLFTFHGDPYNQSPNPRASQTNDSSSMSDDGSPTRNEPPTSSFVLTEDRLESDQPCSEEILVAAKMLNEKMRQVSRHASLVVTNLPDVPEGESAFGYMQFVEHLCADLPRVMLVRGTAAEVITAYT